MLPIHNITVSSASSARLFEHSQDRLVAMSESAVESAADRLKAPSPECEADFDDIEFSDDGSMITIGDSQWSDDALTESSSSAASSEDDDVDPLRRPIDIDIVSGRMPKITIEASSGPVRWFEVNSNYVIPRSSFEQIK